MKQFEFPTDEELEKTAKSYTPKKISQIIDYWIMVAETCGDNREKLSEHVGLFRDIQKLTDDLGRYAMMKVMGNFQEEEGDKEFMLAEPQYKAMEKHLKVIGVPEKYCANLVDSFVTSLYQDKKEMEEMIFGPYAKNLEKFEKSQ